MSIVNESALRYFIKDPREVCAISVFDFINIDILTSPRGWAGTSEG